METSVPGEGGVLTWKVTFGGRRETAQIVVQTDFPPEGPKANTIEVRIK